VINFSDIEAEFIKRVHTMVWCAVATVDANGRPRSRVLHSIWEGSTGFIGTNPNSYKAKHLAHNPYVSLAYIADIAKPVYVDARTEWVNDMSERQRIWDLFKSAPLPLGYDPEPIFKNLDGFGLLKLAPYRIQLDQFPAPSLIWRADHPV